MLELTVFIRVKIANLNALSRFIPEIVNKDDNIKSENINIKTEIKFCATHERQKIGVCSRSGAL